MRFYEGKPGEGMSYRLPERSDARPLFVKPHRFTSRTAWLAVVAFWLLIVWAA